MRVLVTRPEASGHQTAKRLRERGFEPVLLPLTRPVHDIEATGNALRHPHWALAISSAEAARSLEPALRQRPDLLSTLVFAVGPASADAASKAGFTRIETAAGEGVSLADLIAQHWRDNAPRAPLLYMAGHPRSPRFEARLRQHQIEVTVCECYRMLPVVYSATDLERRLGEELPDVVLFYSTESVRRFVALETGHLLRPTTRFLCLSDNILASLPQAWKAGALAASSPTEAALLDLI